MIDAHCHLQDERLEGNGRELLAQARAVGVCAVMCCGSSESDWDDVVALGRLFPDSVAVSLGLHPWHVASVGNGWLERLGNLLRENPCFGVGEIGLDHALEPRNDYAQLDAFRKQIELALELNRPVSIHCRRAWSALLDAMKSIGRFDPGFVVHSFSGSVEAMQELATLNGYVSFSGSLTLSGNRRAAKVACAVPADRMLVETDAPDLMPVTGEDGQPSGSWGRPSGVNVPANLVHVARRLAALRGMTEREVSEITESNARRLFSTCMQGDAG